MNLENRFVSTTFYKNAHKSAQCVLFLHKCILFHFFFHLQSFLLPAHNVHEVVPRNSLGVGSCELANHLLNVRFSELHPQLRQRRPQVTCVDVTVSYWLIFYISITLLVEIYINLSCWLKFYVISLVLVEILY